MIKLLINSKNGNHTAVENLQKPIV